MLFLRPLLWYKARRWEILARPRRQIARPLAVADPGAEFRLESQEGAEE